MSIPVSMWGQVEGALGARRMLHERRRGCYKSLLSFVLWCAVASMGISLFGEIVNPQSEQEMRWGSRKLFTSLNSRLVLSETISSEDYFWGNQANLTFDTAVTLSNKGLFCLRANVHAPKTTCPFPDVRARASGVAIVNIPLEEVAIHVNGWRNASTTKLEGCVWLPVVGTYYLDMNLVHCSINSMTKGNIDAQDLKGRCPIQPVVRPVQEFTFRLDRIERSHQDMELMLDNPRPYVGAWVLAPVCRGSLHRVGKDCTAQSGRKPLMLRTMFQHDTFLQQGGYRSFHDKRLVQRLQDYVFLPTHVVTGEPDYSDGRHATRYYAPPPRPDLSPDTLADKVCILGDSHARYLYAQLVAILEGTTANTTGCQGGMDIKRGILPQKSGNYTLLYEQMEWATTWLQSRSAVRGTLRSCDVIFVSNGHWDAGFPGGIPTPPLTYVHNMLQLLQHLEQTTAASRIYVLSNTPTPLGKYLLECRDWRVPSFMSLYNSFLAKHTMSLADGRDQFVANGLQRSYFLNDGDIAEPLWDAATDWFHPCHNVFRPIAQRMLSLLKVKKDLLVTQ